MHYRVLHESPGMGQVTEYIKSRMRILRGMVINIPLTTIAVCFSLALRYQGPNKAAYLALTVLIGIILTSVATYGWYRISKVWYKRIKQAYEIIHPNEI